MQAPQGDAYAHTGDAARKGEREISRDQQQEAGDEDRSSVRCGRNHAGWIGGERVNKVHQHHTAGTSAMGKPTDCARKIRKASLKRASVNRLAMATTRQ